MSIVFINMLKHIIDQVLRLGTSFSGGLGKSIGLGLFIFSSMAQSSTITIPAGSCSDLTCDHFCELCGAIDTIAGQYHQLMAAVYNSEDILGIPLEGEEERAIMGVVKVVVQENNPVKKYHPYLCAMSKDWTHGVMVYSKKEEDQITRHTLVLTVQEGLIAGIRDVAAERDDLHKELRGLGVTKVHLPLAMAVGMPNTDFSFDENGDLIFQRETIFGDLRDLATAIEKLAKERLEELRSEIETDTKTALEEALEPVNEKMAALSLASENLSKKTEELLSDFSKTTNDALLDFKKELKDAVTSDGDTTRTALETAKTNIKKRIAKEVQASTATTTKKIEDEAEDVKNTLEADIEAAKSTLQQYIQQQLALWRNLLDGVNKDQNNTIVSSLINAIQSGDQNIIDHLTRSMKTFSGKERQNLQTLIGVELDANGNPKGGNLLQQLKRLSDLIETHNLQTPEIYQTLNTLTQLFQQYGALPEHYLGSIQSLLYGHSQFSKTVLVSDSILQRLKEFPELLSNINLEDYKERFAAPIKNIQLLACFMETADVLTINTALPNFIRLFGPKIPVFDVAAYHVNEYCEAAHFTAEDFGLYAWIKDIHVLLKEVQQAAADLEASKNTASQIALLMSLQEAGQITCSCGHTCTCCPGSDQTGNGGVSTDPDQAFAEKLGQIRKKIDELLEGKVDGVQVIPTTYFNGRITPPDLLQECVEIIQQIRRASPTLRLEKKVDVLAKSVQSLKTDVAQLKTEIGHQISHVLAAFTKATRPFVPYPIDFQHCCCLNPGQGESAPEGGTGSSGNDKVEP